MTEVIVVILIIITLFVEYSMNYLILNLAFSLKIC